MRQKLAHFVPAILLVLALLVGIAVGHFAWMSRTSVHGNLVPVVATASTSTTSLALNVVSVHDTSNPLYRIDVEYPEISAAPVEWNASIKTFIDGKIAEFEKNSNDNWKARQDTAPANAPVPAPQGEPFYLKISWSPEQLNAHYLSFIIRLEAFEGGANERQELWTWNYDLEQHRDISLGDLFPNVPDYLTKIAKLSHDELLPQLQIASDDNASQDMLNAGTAPTAENFQNFLFNDQIVTIYFPKYQVAPGVFGEQHVIIPRGSIQ